MKLLIKLFFVCIIILPGVVKAQCDSLYHYLGNGKTDVIEIGGSFADEWPQFPGGEEARVAFFKENIKLPDNWRPDSITGKVFITFLVDEEGNIKYPCILRGLNSILDSITISTIRKMPKWVPAKQRGVPVRVQFNLPIKFGSDINQE
jgi:periplasmic protein TonB